MGTWMVTGIAGIVDAWGNGRAWVWRLTAGYPAARNEAREVTDEREGETPYTPGSVAYRYADGHPSRPDVAARLQRPTRRPDEQPECLLLGLAPDEACHAVAVTNDPVVSYTAVSPLPDVSRAVCSLLRYLSGHPGRTLSAIVLCGARKFLSHGVERHGRGHQEVSNNPF